MKNSDDHKYSPMRPSLNKTNSDALKPSKLEAVLNDQFG